MSYDDEKVNKGIIQYVADPNMPIGPKISILISALAGLGYTVSPVDLISDIVPLLGYSDDLVLLVLVYLFIKKQTKIIK